MDSTLMMSKESQDKLDPIGIHWVWLDDPDESCCGLDMTGRPFVDEEELPVDCEDCIYAMEFVDRLERNLNG